MESFSSSGLSIGSGRLSVEDVVRVARNRAHVAELTPEAEARMEPAANWVARTVEQIAGTPKAYYGINTGFGAQAGRSALNSRYLTEVLGRNLMASHSVGVGPYFEEAVVRAVLLIRAHSLAQGVSGVRPLVPAKLIAMLNGRVYPAIPEMGSLGSEVRRE